MKVVLGLADNAASGLAGIGLFLALASFVIAIVWVVFPFIVIAKFNALLRLSREILIELRKSRVVQPAAPASLLPATPAAPPLPAVKPPDLPSGNFFYMSKSSEVSGPIGKAELQRLHSAGEIDDSTLVQAEFSGDWQPLRSYQVHG